jgi:hypothetical protein
VVLVVSCRCYSYLSVPDLSTEFLLRSYSRGVALVGVGPSTFPGPNRWVAVEFVAHTGGPRYNMGVPSRLRFPALQHGCLSTFPLDARRGSRALHTVEPAISTAPVLGSGSGRRGRRRVRHTNRWVALQHGCLSPRLRFLTSNNMADRRPTTWLIDAKQHGYNRRSAFFLWCRSGGVASGGHSAAFPRRRVPPTSSPWCRVPRPSTGRLPACSPACSPCLSPLYHDSGP